MYFVLYILYIIIYYYIITFFDNKMYRGHYVMTTYNIKFEIQNDSDCSELIKRFELNKNKNLKCLSLTLTLIKTQTTTINDNNNNKENEDNKYLFVPNKILNIINPYDKRLQTGYFAFMLIRIIHNVYEDKNDAIIAFSQNPILSVYTQNINKTKRDKNNNSNWVLSEIIGPFESSHICLECCKKWQDQTRGIKSKRIRAIELQQEFNRDLYTISFPLDKNTLDSVLNDLPNRYRDTIKNYY